MNIPEWLNDPAARAVSAHSLDFGDAQGELHAALTETVVSPLLHLGTLRAQGADTDTFLQGQLSNDLRLLTTRRAQLSSYNSPKGRVLALLALMRAADGGVLLELRRDLLEATLKRLRMFVLRSKLVLDNASDRLPILGIAGPQAEPLLAALGLDTPQANWDCVSAEGLTAVRRPGGTPRFSLHGEEARIAAAWELLSARARAVGTEAWRLLDLTAGLPSIGPATVDQFIAQMLNLEQLGAISFTKGCYPGQEIVARLHYLGNLKRRLIAGVTAIPPEEGAALYAAGAGTDAAPVGYISDSCRHPADGALALAVVQAEILPGNVLHVSRPDGGVLKVTQGFEQPQKRE